MKQLLSVILLVGFLFSAPRSQAKEFDFSEAYIDCWSTSINGHEDALWDEQLLAIKRIGDRYFAVTRAAQYGVFSKRSYTPVFEVSVATNQYGMSFKNADFDIDVKIFFDPYSGSLMGESEFETNILGLMCDSYPEEEMKRVYSSASKGYGLAVKNLIQYGL